MDYIEDQQQMQLHKGVLSKQQRAKRVNIISLKVIREKSVLYKDRVIRFPEDGYELLNQYLGEVDREHFLVLCLDTKNQPTSLNVCHVGSLNSSVVHPREVYKPAILSNAASIIVGHNHPSGNPDASAEDIKVTKRLQQSGELLGIELLDHIILGADCFTSLKEKGEM